MSNCYEFLERLCSEFKEKGAELYAAMDDKLNEFEPLKGHHVTDFIFRPQSSSRDDSEILSALTEVLHLHFSELSDWHVTHVGLQKEHRAFQEERPCYLSLRYVPGKGFQVVVICK